jgi:nucleoside-diphosphate-sugar epimerase
VSLVLVTGATGMVGPRVVEAFAAAGFQVRTFSRDPIEEGRLPAGVDERIGNVTDAAAVRQAISGVDVVVHLAALLHLPDPPLDLRGEYARVNVEGTRAVVAAAQEAEVARVVFFSTIAVYGDTGRRVLDEDGPVHPRTLYAATKAEAERIVLEGRRRDGAPLGVVLRPGSVYGARVKGNYRRLVEALARRRFVPVGDGLNRRAMVYDRDVASATVLAAAHPAAAGRVYNVSDGEEHTLAAIIEAICSALGRHPPRWHLPLRPARAGVGLVEDAARLLQARAPVTRATLDKYTEDKVVDSRRIRRELGFVPRYDLRAGWRETIDAMREAGEI